MSEAPKYPDGGVIMDEHVNAEHIAELSAEAERLRGKLDTAETRIAEAVAAERERCAQIAECRDATAGTTIYAIRAGQRIAAAIRKGEAYA